MTKKEYWTDPCGIKRLLPSPKYQLTVTVAGRTIHRYIFKRDNYTCQLCGEPALNVDHIITRRYGGTHHPRNLQAVCWACNSHKTWFDRDPFQTIKSVRAVLSAINDESGATLLWILEMLREARIVNKDSTKRANLLINSGIISGEYSGQQT